MDSKLYRELSEAYLNVYAPMEEMDEAVENLDEISANLALTASQKADEERRKASVSGDKATAAKKAAQASRLYKGVGPRRTRERMGGMKEEVDVFDEVIEFLYVEGYAETLEEAEWMMANIIDEEAIDIILGEEQLDEISQKTATKAYATSSTGEFEGADSDRDIKRTDNLRRQIKRKFGDKAAKHADRAAHSMTFGRKGMPPKPTKEDFEFWVDSLVEEGYDLSDYTWDEMYEFYLDEAEGSYGATPKAYSAASKTKMTAKRKPFLKKMKSRTNPANRTSAYDSPRKGMTSDDRERARAGAAHGVGTRQDHDYPSQGAGGVTKNPKKLRKQKAMGEFAKEEYVDEAQEARNNPEKYEREQSKKSAPVRGEKTPMPPRGDKRREDFEKWYAKNVR